MKSVIKQYLQKSGFSLRRHSPYLLQHPETELLISFPLVVAHHVLRVTNRPFFFIQVGAFDGKSNDPINEFVRNLKWHGVLIEPQSEPFALLQKNYCDQPQLSLVQAALSDIDGTKPFYKVRQDLGEAFEGAQQFASFDKETILAHKHLFAGLENAIVAEPTATITFPTILTSHHIEEVDLLQVDAEGYDFEIIKIFPFERIRPAIVHYEHLHLKDNAEASWIYLAERGYLISANHVDTTAYRKDLSPYDVNDLS